MPEDTFEDIRERLFRAAWGEPVYAPDRERVVTRARRRAATTVAGAALIAVVAIVVAATAFPSAEPRDRTARTEGDDRILVVDVSGGGVRETQVFPDDAYYFEVAPGGGSVAFVRKSERPQIWVADVDGSDLRRVTRDPYGAGWPAWSPNGESLAYLGYAGAGRATLFIVDVRTGQRRQLLPERDREPRAPAWSPDGTKIAYHVDMEAPRGQLPSGSIGLPDVRSHLRVVDVATGRVSRVPGNGTSSLDANWLPDGRLVFMRTVFDPHRSELWVAHADGSDARKLATVARDAWAWGTRASPDGSRVTFVVQGMSGPTSQNVIDLATGSIRRLTEAYGAVWLDDDTLLLEAPPVASE